MKAVYALYPDGHSAQAAVDRLREAGIVDRDITVMSSRPMDEHEFGRMDSRNGLWWMACGGALVGTALAVAFIWVSATGWEIDVGGMPVIAWWPATIITFELAMLGAIVATAIALVMTAGLGRSRGRLHDPAVSDGQILVGVENLPAGRADDIRTALGKAPGARLKTV